MNNQNKNYELIKFEDGDFTLDVNVSPEEDTVWLTQKQMSQLFNVSVDNISLHKINPFVCHRRKPTAFRRWEEPFKSLVIILDFRYIFV